MTTKTQKRLETLKELNAVQRQLAAQSAVHAELAFVYDDIGGRQTFSSWAKEHQTEFYRMFVKATPNLIPSHGMQGDINITINAKLEESALDGEYDDAEEADYEDVDNDDYGTEQPSA